MGVALLIPLTFGMPAVEAFSALLGMYVGAIYGGCITAILVGTPGTVSAAATMLEGPALTARGESRRALDMATIASFVGGIVSALALIFIAPMLARAAMSFGAPEYFAVAVFGLTVVASLSSGHLVKGLISALAGLFLATIGLDPVTGDMRNTFDNPNLFNGLSLVPVLVGLFAVSQVLVTVEDVVRGVSLKESTVSKRGISLKDLTGNVVNFIRSSVIGTLIGIIPATGVSAASFLAYSEAKRFQDAGNVRQGLCGGHRRNGILQQRGMRRRADPSPDPRGARRHHYRHHARRAHDSGAHPRPAPVRGTSRYRIRHLRRLHHRQYYDAGVLMPIVITLCVVGGYAVNNSTFDLLVVAIFGTVGYLMIKCDFPQPPLLLAMILEPIAEANFRRALTISQNDYSIFYTSPVACIILLVSLLVLLKPIYDDFRAGRKAAA